MLIVAIPQGSRFPENVHHFILIGAEFDVAAKRSSQ